MLETGICGSAMNSLYKNISRTHTLNTSGDMPSHSLFLPTPVYSAVVPSGKVSAYYIYLAHKKIFEGECNSNANFVYKVLIFFSEYLIFKQLHTKIATTTGHKECASKQGSQDNPPVDTTKSSFSQLKNSEPLKSTILL